MRLSSILGRQVFAHETNPAWGEAILNNGFEDPFDYDAEDSYHVPGSVRYGKAFFWPHSVGIGKNDREGAVVIAVADLSEVLVSTYESFSALVSQERYARLPSVFQSERILPPEYEENHVFGYLEYLDWLESDSRINDGHTISTLFPYRR